MEGSMSMFNFLKARGYTSKTGGKQPTGIISSDGRRYTKEEWEAAENLMIGFLIGRCQIREASEVKPGRMEVVGSVNARRIRDGKIYEFYMRDLVRGIVRESNGGPDRRAACEEYQRAVRQAGLIIRREESERPRFEKMVRIPW